MPWYNFHFVLIYIPLFVLVSCSPGQSDYTTNISGSSYLFTSNNSLNQFIWKKNETNNRNKIIIPNRVIKYYSTDKFITAVSQVAKSYSCDEETIATIISLNVDFWLIDISKDIVFGPLSDKDFYIMAEKYQLPGRLIPKIEEYSKNIRTEPKELLECTNPLEITS